MIHRGNILEKAVKESKFKITDLARRMGVDRTTLYNWFNTPNLPYETLIQIGKIIQHNFNKDFAYSTEFQQAQEVAEAAESYSKPIDYKEKYFKLLEEQNSLLKTKTLTYDSLIKAISELAANINNKTAIQNFGDDLKATLLNNNKDLSEKLQVIAEAITIGPH